MICFRVVWLTIIQNKMSLNNKSGIYFYLQKTGQVDDILRVYCDPDSDGYCAKFSQPSIGTETEKYFVYLYEAVEYLNVFRDLLLADRNPYHAYQLDVPGFPAVILDRTSLARDWCVVKDAIYSLRREWPVERMVA